MEFNRHYAEALSSLESAWETDVSKDQRAILIADAQVHATLALVDAVRESRR